MRDRDYYTGLDLVFQQVYEPSDGYAMVQLQRTKPQPFRIKKGQEKPGGRVAIMQALRYHFGKSCSEIAELMGFPEPRRSRTLGIKGKGQAMVSKLTIGGSPECGLDWFQRQYKKEAIAAAQKLLEAQ